MVDIAVVLNAVPSVASTAAALATLSSSSFLLRLTCRTTQCKVIVMPHIVSQDYDVSVKGGYHILMRFVSDPR